MPVPWSRLLAAAAGACLLGACSTPRSTEASRQRALVDVQDGRFADANAEINGLYDSAMKGDRTKPGGSPATDTTINGKQALLWHMERGMVGHIQGDLLTSDQHLDAAADLVDLRRSKNAVKETGTYLTNDTVRDYAGHPYEHIQIDYYRALNRVMIAQVDTGLFHSIAVDPSLPPPPEGAYLPRAIAMVPRLAPDAAGAAADNYDQAISFGRRMTINQLQETADAAGSHRYQDDPFGRTLAGALIYAPPESDRSPSDMQFADTQFKRAVAGYAEQRRTLGDGRQPFRYEVRGRPHLLDALLIRNGMAYDPVGFREHAAEYGLNHLDPRLKHAGLPPGYGMILVLNHVGFITHPRTLDIRLIAASIPVASQTETSQGVSVSTFHIGALAFYAKGPGSDIVNAWGEIILPGDVIQELLAPGGAAFMGFALPVHPHDAPIDPPAMLDVQSSAGGEPFVRPLEVVSDLDAYARATLKDEQPALLTKTLIRAAAKQAAAAVAARTMQNQGGSAGQLLGFAVGLVGSTAATLSEVADTRSWTTLPDHIEACLVDVPVGTYSLHLDASYGTFAIGSVTVPAGRLVIVPVRSFPRPLPPPDG
jgi:hypothetical protein